MSQPLPPKGYKSGKSDRKVVSPDGGGDQPTILISSEDKSMDKTTNIHSSGYSVKPRKAGYPELDEATGVTEEISVEEVQDVVVLLDEPSPASAPNGKATGFHGRGQLRHDDSDLASVSHLPELETLEDITSLIRESDSGELHAPGAGNPEVELTAPHRSMGSGRSKIKFFAIAALGLMVLTAGFFLLLGDKPESGLSEPVVSATAGAEPGKTVAVNSTAEKFKEARQEFSQWTRNSLQQGFFVR